MSGTPVSHATHPPHGHPSNTAPSTQKSDKASTASHPPASKPDPTTSAPHPKFHPPGGATGAHTDAAVNQNAAQRGQPAANAAGAAEQPSAVEELPRLKTALRQGLRQFPDFPSPGILFEDIMPLFSNPSLHSSLIRALELQVAEAFGTVVGQKSDIDVVVGLESRGFLMGPTLALRLGAGFVPVRKEGKLPGECERASYQKEYGADHFQMQKDAVRPGQKVVIIDDIIATGGSAAAAGSLVRKLGGELVGYIFLMELDFLKGRDKLDAPVHTLLSGQEEALKKADELPLGRTKETAEEANKPVQDAGGSAAEQRP